MSSASGGALGGMMSGAQVERVPFIDMLRQLHEHLTAGSDVINRTSVALHSGPIPREAKGPTGTPSGAIGLVEEMIELAKNIYCAASDLHREIYGEVTDTFKGR